MNWRHLLLFPAMLFTAVAVEAQGNEVARVRQLYAEAKQEIAKREKMQESEQRPGDVLVVNSDYMAPGAGPTHDVSRYYHTGGYDELLATVFYRPFFISRKYNVGAAEFYQEFLYDQTDESNLVFFFQKGPDGEIRFYWGENGLAHKAVKGECPIDNVFAQRLATDLREAFDRLINREY